MIPPVISKTPFPSGSFTAIKLSVYRNAKPQLGIRVYRAKLGLGVPSRADFTLNASKLNGSEAGAWERATRKLFSATPTACASTRDPRRAGTPKEESRPPSTTDLSWLPSQQTRRRSRPVHGRIDDIPKPCRF